MEGWQEREALNEAGTRDRNEWIHHQTERVDGAGQHLFVCECGDCTCEAPIELTLAEYDAVRAYPTRFAIAVNHENPEAEYVVRETNRFAIIDKVDRRSRQIAQARDPRR